MPARERGERHADDAPRARGPQHFLRPIEAEIEAETVARGEPILDPNAWQPVGLGLVGKSYTVAGIRQILRHHQDGDGMAVFLDEPPPGLFAPGPLKTRGLL